MATAELQARVVDMVARGVPVREIAREIGISEPTLRAHYAAELHGPRPQINFPLAEFDTPPPQQPARANAGRPPHFPTDESRDKVGILLAAGMQVWQIAQALDISEPTLRAHYAAELETGRSRKRADVIDAMFRAAIAGNVAAQKAYLAQDQDLDAPPPPAQERIGKKEQAERDALMAGDGVDWARHLPH